MPIYEYRCSKCNKTVEILQKFDDPAPSRCENCGTEASLNKLISQAAFHLKGTGWYVTDFKNKSNKIEKPKVESESSSEAIPNTSPTADAAKPSESSSETKADPSPAKST